MELAFPCGGAPGGAQVPAKSGEQGLVIEQGSAPNLASVVMEISR